MEHLAGLDMSMEKASVCVIDGRGEVVREAKVATDPDTLAEFLRNCGVTFGRIGFEAGPFAPWLYAGLAAAGLPVICIETRRMKAFASASPVKTDRKAAQLIAQAMRVGLYRPVHVKTGESQQARMFLTHRRTLLGQIRQLENTRCAGR